MEPSSEVPRAPLDTRSSERGSRARRRSDGERTTAHPLFGSAIRSTDGFYRATQAARTFWAEARADAVHITPTHPLFCSQSLTKAALFPSAQDLIEISSPRCQRVPLPCPARCRIGERPTTGNLPFRRNTGRVPHARALSLVGPCTGGSFRRLAMSVSAHATLQTFALRLRRLDVEGRPCVPHTPNDARARPSPLRS